MSLVSGEPQSCCLSLRKCVLQHGEGWAAMAGEGILERGGLAQADGLFVKTLKTPRIPLQPQAELSPQSRTRGSGLPTE